MGELNGPNRLTSSGRDPDSLVIMLHGVGADGNDLMGLAPLFDQILPNTAFHAPNAPEPYGNAPFGYQWYLIDNDLSKTEGLYAVAPLVDKFINDTLDRYNIAPDRCVLLGFSQGTIVALHVALRRKEPLAGVLGYSGLLMAGDNLKHEIGNKAPVCLIHGAEDTLLSYYLTEEADSLLVQLGVPSETHVLPGLGHAIDQRGIQIGGYFLQKHLPVIER